MGLVDQAFEVSSRTIERVIKAGLPGTGRPVRVVRESPRTEPVETPAVEPEREPVSVPGREPEKVPA